MTNTQLIEWVVWAEQVSRDIVDAEFYAKYRNVCLGLPVETPLVNWDYRMTLQMTKYDERNTEYHVRCDIDLGCLEGNILNDKFMDMMRRLVSDMVIARQDELEG